MVSAVNFSSRRNSKETYSHAETCTHFTKQKVLEYDSELYFISLSLNFSLLKIVASCSFYLTELTTKYFNLGFDCKSLRLWIVQGVVGQAGREAGRHPIRFTYCSRLCIVGFPFHTKCVANIVIFLFKDE